MNIEQVLAEANLTPDQIEQIVSIVREEKRSLRETHLAESRALLSSKDEAIAGLLRQGLAHQEQLNEAKEMPPSEEKVAEIEAEAKKEARKEARSELEEALRPHRNNIRALRNYGAMASLVESLQTAFAGVMANAPLASTPSAHASPLSESRVVELEEQVLSLGKEKSFAAATAHLAETTVEKVRSIVDATSVTTLDEYNVILSATVAGVAKPIPPASTELNEAASAKNDPMGRYLAALGSRQSAK